MSARLAVTFALAVLLAAVLPLLSWAQAEVPGAAEAPDQHGVVLKTASTHPARLLASFLRLEPQTGAVQIVDSDSSHPE